MTAKGVDTTKMTVPYMNDEQDFGELRVYFGDSWDIYEEGLIYTDKLFIKELKEILVTMGFDDYDVSYSEQGMQGKDYVSFDIGKNFFNTWEEINE